MLDEARTRRPLAAAVAVALFALAGCGTDNNPTAGNSGTAATRENFPGPGLVTRIESVSWELVRARGRRVVIRYMYGNCGARQGKAHAVVNQRDARVTVRVLAPVTRLAKHPPPRTACADIAIGARLRLTLRTSLGARTLVHAPTTI
jgi:hypothetical protein